MRGGRLWEWYAWYDCPSGGTHGTVVPVPETVWWSYHIICSLPLVPLICSHTVICMTSYHRRLPSPFPANTTCYYYQTTTTSHHHVSSAPTTTNNHHHLPSARTITTYYHHQPSPPPFTMYQYHLPPPRTITTYYRHQPSPGPSLPCPLCGVPITHHWDPAPPPHHRGGHSHALSHSGRYILLYVQ